MRPSARDFGVAVKLNSADFQKGGFTHEEAVEIAIALDRTGALDFLELSGGNYESPALMGKTKYVKSAYRSMISQYSNSYRL